MIGTALSARAACELRDSAGIESVTTVRLLGDLERGFSLTGRDVVVVDEAGMVGTRALERIAAASADGGAKLVLVGDDRQLPEIEAGGAFSALADWLGARELTEARRQRQGWDREALAELRAGRPDAGYMRTALVAGSSSPPAASSSSRRSSATGGTHAPNSAPTTSC